MHEVAAARGIDVASLHDNWTGDWLPAGTASIYVCDFDRDGLLDLLVCDINGYWLYQGLPDGRFQEVTTAIGLEQACRRSGICGTGGLYRHRRRRLGRPHPGPIHLPE